MVALVAALHLVLNAGTLHVDLSLDAQLPCKANAALEQSIRARLPRARIRTHGAAAPGDLTVRIVSRQSAFIFEVRKHDGSVAMQRDLYSSCAQLGELSGLILERYLAGISWSGSEAGLVAQPPAPPTPKPLPAPPLVEPPTATDAGAPPDAGEPLDAGSEPLDAGEPYDAGADDLIRRIGVTPAPLNPRVVEAPEPSGTAPSASPAPAAVDAGAAIVQPEPAPAPHEPVLSEVSLSAGGGVWNGSSFNGAFSLDVAALLIHRIRIALLGIVSLPHATAVVMPVGTITAFGSITAFDAAGFLSAGLCTRGDLTVCGSVVGGERFISGSASGTYIFQKQPGTAAVPAFGLHARLAYALPWHLLVALDVLADVPVRQATVKVTTEAPVTFPTTPDVDLAATVQVGVRL